MNRSRTFIAVETAVLFVLEGVNIVALAPEPTSHRLANGLFIAAYFAFGFWIPASPRWRTVRLVADVVLLFVAACLSGLAATMTILLGTRALELKPADRRAFILCIGAAVIIFAISFLVGEFIEHRPAELLVPFTLPVLYGMGLALLIAERNVRESRTALEAANVQLALHAAHSEEIGTLTERYRIARALQEDVERGLTTIGEQLDSALDRRGADPAAADLLTFRAQRTAAFTLAALKRNVSELREDSLARGGVAAALRDLCKAFASAGSRLSVQANIDEVEIDDPAVVAGLERIAREALINVVRHAEASAAVLSFSMHDDRLELVVSDNGMLSRPLESGADNLDAIRARVKAVGGTCTVMSSPEGGTTLRVTVPRSL
jgi:signal transduction histidine kinase